MYVPTGPGACECPNHGEEGLPELCHSSLCSCVWHGVGGSKWMLVDEWIFFLAFYIPIKIMIFMVNQYGKYVVLRQARIRKRSGLLENI
jgi:hypothetical protein